MRDELDTILDQAIQSYSVVEPSPDLAQRIVYQSQLRTASPRPAWKLAVAFALPVAAALALALIFAGRMNLPAPPAPIASAPSTPNVAIHAQPLPAETVAAAAEPIHAHRRIRKTGGRSSENGESWARPLPPPYSKEELALLNFVQQHPKEAAEIAEAQKQDSAPLELQPITISQIKPLSIAP